MSRPIITDVNTFRGYLAGLLADINKIVSGYREGYLHYPRDRVEHSVGLRDDKLRMKAMTIKDDYRHEDMRSFPWRIESRTSLLLDQTETPLDDFALFLGFTKHDRSELRRLIEEIRGLNRKYSPKGARLYKESRWLDSIITAIMRNNWRSVRKGTQLKDGYGVGRLPHEAEGIVKKKEGYIKQEVKEMLAHYKEVEKFALEAMGLANTREPLTNEGAFERLIDRLLPNRGLNPRYSH